MDYCIFINRTWYIECHTYKITKVERKNKKENIIVRRTHKDNHRK